MEENNQSESQQNAPQEKKRLKFMPTKIFKWVTNSAIFGLILTLAIFLYEQYKSAQQTKEIVENLLYVQKSLSTKYLGLFPDYLNQINELMDGAQPNDTIVIFEDVSYYGFVSKPDEFKQMQKQLLSLSDSGAQITMACYNPTGRSFKRMIIDQYISTDLTGQMDHDRRALFEHRDRSVRGSFKELKVQDSIIVENYFSLTREKHPHKFKKSVDARRKPISHPTGKERGLDRELEELYANIDSAKSRWLSADYKDLSIADIEGMYREVSYLMADLYKKHGIELIFIDENLSIACWLVSDKAILAFPSKYATDEIGFYSHDPAFSKYIKTMLNGFRGNYSKIEMDATHD